MNNILYILALWNILVFLIYAYDKFQAKRRGWRISEKTLFLCAIFMGGAGAYVSMQIFRHKTKHASFKLLVPVCAVYTCIFAAWLAEKFI